MQQKRCKQIARDSTPGCPPNANGYTIFFYLFELINNPLLQTRPPQQPVLSKKVSMSSSSLTLFVCQEDRLVTYTLMEVHPICSLINDARANGPVAKVLSLIPLRRPPLQQRLHDG